VRKNPKAKSDLDKLIEIYKQKDQDEGNESPSTKKKVDSSKTED
jgi:hypothetical protein